VGARGLGAGGKIEATPKRRGFASGRGREGGRRLQTRYVNPESVSAFGRSSVLVSQRFHLLFLADVSQHEIILELVAIAAILYTHAKRIESMTPIRGI
jgi:hypothetical protein